MEKFNELIQSPKPVLVDFYAEWCGPCQIMKPRILDVMERMGDDIQVIQIDVDKEKELATSFRISSSFRPSCRISRKKSSRQRLLRSSCSFL